MALFSQRFDCAFGAMTTPLDNHYDVMMLTASGTVIVPYRPWTDSSTDGRNSALAQLLLHNVGGGEANDIRTIISFPFSYVKTLKMKSISILICTCLIYQVSLTPIQQQNCVYDRIKQNIHIQEAKLPTKDVSKRSVQSKQPIRITPYYVPNKLNMSSSNQAYLKNTIIPNVLQYFAAALAVTPVTGNLSFNPCTIYYNGGVNDGKCSSVQSSACGPNTITTDVLAPQHYTTVDLCSNGSSTASCTSYGGGGISESDYIMYIYAQYTALCQAGTVAYASACKVDIATKRPILGFVNFCPDKFVSTTQFETLRFTAIHEFFHALGFSSSLFSNFQRPNGTTYIANSVMTINGKKVNVINSPKVVEVARQYYNCSTIQGVELEDAGGEGSVGSHWEMRTLRDELMTAAIVVGLADVVSISKFTLALMEDSGWYQVNYTAESKHQLLWGKGLGCNFVQGSCKNQASYPYACSKEATSGCTFDYFAQGLCQTNLYMDNCTVFMPASASVCSSTGLSNNCGNKFGANSKCAMGTLGQSVNVEKAQCIEYRCYRNTTSGQTVIKATAGNNQEMTCSTTGQKLQFSGCSGSVTCPPAAAACARTMAENGGVLPILCGSACSSCTSSSACTACQTGFYLYNLMCYASCPSGTYTITGNSTHCFACNTNKCVSCRNSPDYCTACSGGKVASLGGCVNSCSTGQTLQGTECKDDGTTIVQSYQVIFPEAEDNLASSQANIIAEFKKSLGLSDSTIKNVTVSVNRATNTTSITVLFQGSYSTINNTSATLIKKVQDQTLSIPINQNSVTAMSYKVGQATVIPPTQAATTKTAASSSATPSATPTVSFWDKPFAGLKVWQWIAIGGGSLGGIVLIAVIGCCVCLRKESNKKKAIRQLAQQSNREYVDNHYAETSRLDHRGQYPDYPPEHVEMPLRVQSSSRGHSHYVRDSPPEDMYRHGNPYYVPRGAPQHYDRRNDPPLHYEDYRHGRQV
ncbi:Leishmanolysin-like peptidase [Trichoplax sp. H2]|nr:Leishmanolysin-like peptidase [Trichoplax sp. H2]|eukprot:RDD40195.1 Leishmanolysin-like peptidase [Trichoplax sp. H2]